MKRDDRDKPVGSVSLVTMTMIKIYGRSVVLVGEVCIYGEYQSCQDRERTSRYRLITVFLQIRVNQITREIVPVANQNEAGGATENRSHCRKHESLQKEESEKIILCHSTMLHCRTSKLVRSDRVTGELGRKDRKFNFQWNRFSSGNVRAIQQNRCNSAFDFQFSKFSVKRDWQK